MKKSPNSYYEPHNYIALAVAQLVRKYNLEKDEDASIISIILYFLHKDAGIVRTKLEQYMLLLNDLVFRQSEKKLFKRDFPFGVKEVLQKMVDKGIITKKNQRHFTFDLDDDFFEGMYSMQVRNSLNYIAEQWKNASVEVVKNEIRKIMKGF